MFREYDGNVIAAGLRELAAYFEETPEKTGATIADVAAMASPVPAQKRGRGRPVKGETPPPAVPAAPAEAVEAADPFTTSAAAPALPVATIDDVRAALKFLQGATNQATALKALVDAGGANNLSSLPAAKYDAVVAAAKAATPQAGVQVETDPFETPSAPTAAPAVALTIQDVKNAVVAAQKRTGTDKCQKIVMDHGGKAPKPDGAGEGPALSKLPEAKYAAVIKALEALPTTK